MKQQLRQWADKFIKSGTAAIFVIALAIAVISTGSLPGTNPPQGDDAMPMVNWNAGGG